MKYFGGLISNWNSFSWLYQFLTIQPQRRTVHKGWPVDIFMYYITNGKMEKNGKYILLEGAHKSCSFKLIHVYHIYLNEKYCYHTIHILFITFVKYVTYSYLFITACLTYSKLHMSYTWSFYEHLSIYSYGGHTGYHSIISAIFLWPRNFATMV